MLRKFALLALVAGVVAILVPSGASSATGACALKGTANITPGLTTAKKSFSFTFSGNLSSCNGTGSAKKATLSASGTGSGTCANTKGNGTSTVRWNTGQTSSISFTFTGVGNAVLVQGKVTSGLFAGQAVKAPIAFTSAKPSPAACASTGITQLAFQGATALS